ncbi:MAG: alpha/beta fold hydrolase [Myxococcales bacterium]|nr:alpha/beta fold hydrolase [Myxococcales bacterium]
MAPRRSHLAVVAAAMAVALVAALASYVWLRQRGAAQGPTDPPDSSPTPVAPPQSPGTRTSPVADPTPVPRLQDAERQLPGSWVDVGGATADPSAPLVIGLHGRGDTAEHFTGLAGRLGPRLAWRMLQGPLRFGDGFQWFRMDAADGGSAELERALQYLDAHVRAAGPRQIALVGFSQGCFLAAAYLVQRPERVRVVLCIGGGLPTLPEAPATTARPAILFVHGGEDAVIPVQAARDAMRRLEALGFSPEFIEHAEGHVVPEAELERMRGWLERKLRAP